jgi:PIN domain nuclease of toxin-antitoxin system
VTLLLDTHAFLWWTQKDPRLTSVASRAIARSDCYVSIASCWEIAIKVSIGRLRFDRPVRQFLTDQLRATGFSLLGVEFRHVMRVAELPFHHRDPFDRLLVAQALETDCVIISADRAFDAYDAKRVW